MSTVPGKRAGAVHRSMCGNGESGTDERVQRVGVGRVLRDGVVYIQNLQRAVFFKGRLEERQSVEETAQRLVRNAKTSTPTPTPTSQTYWSALARCVHALLPRRYPYVGLFADHLALEQVQHLWCSVEDPLRVNYKTRPIILKIETSESGGCL